MKTVLFARVSSREQEETGYSLPSQEKLLKDYAERKEFKIAKKFSISESASGKYQRKSFDEMLDYVKRNDIKIIVCEKVDRLTRNLRDAVSINDWINGNSEREVHFVKENCVLSKESKSNEKFIWNIKVSVAQYYIDNLSEEVKKGQKEKVAQGWLPTKPPLGYKTIGDKGHKIHVPNEKTAPFVRKAFELYATGNYSLYKLAGALYDEGARSSLGNRITKSRWAELFSDPFFIGKFYWKGELHAGNQKHLISDDLFLRVQEVLKSKATPKYSKHFLLFKALLKCKYCGGQITWEIKKGHHYGHCNYYRFCDKRTYVREEKIEEQLISYLDKIEIKNSRLIDWIQQALKESHKDEIEYHKNNRDELNRQFEEIQNRLSRLYDDKLDGKIALDMYDIKFKQYSQQKGDILEAMQGQNTAETAYYELGVNILELSRNAKELYHQAQKDDKRMLLNLVFSDLRLDGKKLEAQYSLPFAMLAERNEQLKSSKMPESVKLSSEILEPSFPEQKRAFQPKFASMLRG